MRARRLLRKIQGRGGAVDLDAWDYPIRRLPKKWKVRVTDRTKYESAPRLTQKHVDGQIKRLLKAGLVMRIKGIYNSGNLVAAVRRARA